MNGPPRFLAKKGQFERVLRPLLESEGQDPAFSILCVPYLLDSGPPQTSEDEVSVILWEYDLDGFKTYHDFVIKKNLRIHLKGLRPRRKIVN